MANINFTGTTVAASATITAVSSVAGLAVGQPIVGAGIPWEATIAAVGTTTITISAPATASASGVALTATTLAAGYSSSLGQAGIGTQLSIGGPASGAAEWVGVGEIDDIPDFLPEWEMVDTTNLQSSIKEMKPTILGTKDVSLECNRVSTDAGQSACVTAYSGNPPVPYWFRIVVKANTAAGQTTTGDTWVFTAYVKKCGPKGVKATEWIKTAIDLTIVSAPVFTEGA